MSCLAGSTPEPNRFGYTRCGSLEEVFAALAEHGERARPVAGGTDLVVWMQARRLEPCHLIDLSRVAELRGIEQNEDSLRLGALSTYADLLESALVKDQAPLLQQASGGGHILKVQLLHGRPALPLLKLLEGAGHLGSRGAGTRRERGMQRTEAVRWLVRVPW